MLFKFFALLLFAIILYITQPLHTYTDEQIDK